jgi:EpsI family protein
MIKINPSDRRDVSRREAIAGIMMLSAATAAFARMPNIKQDLLGKAKLDDVIPDQIGKWRFVDQSGLVLPPEDQLSLALYSQLLTRVYWDGVNPPVMLLIAYSANQTGFLQVHRPEICYSAGGFALGPITPQSIEVGPGQKISANLMPATLRDSTEFVLYWTRIGSAVPPTWSAQRWAIALDNLKQIIPDAALVRISTIMPDKADAVETLTAFAQALVTSPKPEFRKVLIG